MYRSPMELRDLVQVYNDKKGGGGGECDYGFKLIIIGDAGAGKSSFMHQFLEGKFRISRVTPTRPPVRRFQNLRQAGLLQRPGRCDFSESGLAKKIRTVLVSWSR